MPDKSKCYIVTLIKDLPEVKAGFSFSVHDRILKKAAYVQFTSNINGMSDYEYNIKVRQVLQYIDNEEWVSKVPDLSNALKIQCPNCKSVGMFQYFDDDLERVYESDVTRWYQRVGLECPQCSYKIHTHSVCIKTKVDW